MASLTTSPTVARVGQQVSIQGEDFAAAGTVVISMPQLGISSEVIADAGGNIGTDDPADAAVQTLTLAGNAVADETVTIGAVVYTWKAAPTTVANEVKVEASASASLDNLRAAIEAGTGSGTLYGSATVVHPTVEVVSKSATALILNAKTGGTGGNSLASTETMTNGSFGAATFAGGAAATGVSPLLWTPNKTGRFLIEGTDGSTSASTYVQVWASS